MLETSRNSGRMEKRTRLDGSLLEGIALRQPLRFKLLEIPQKLILIWPIPRLERYEANPCMSILDVKKTLTHSEREVSP